MKWLIMHSLLWDFFILPRLVLDTHPLPSLHKAISKQALWNQSQIGGAILPNWLICNFDRFKATTTNFDALKPLCFKIPQKCDGVFCQQSSKAIIIEFLFSSTWNHFILFSNLFSTKISVIVLNICKKHVSSIQWENNERTTNYRQNHCWLSFRKNATHERIQR